MRTQAIIYDIDLLTSILWQYNKATNLQAIIQNKQNFLDENNKKFWEDWYNDVFNLVTANDFGLSVWSIILNVPFLVQIFDPQKQDWGFDQLPPQNSYFNYERGNFARGASRIILSSEDQRIFLRLRYFQLTSRGSTFDTNKFLDLIFNDPLGTYQGGAWVIDNLDMTNDYFFNTNISSSLLNALQFYDILPRPAGVSLTYTTI